MKKLTPLDNAKIVLLHNTGAINQKQLAKLFNISHERISEIVRTAQKK